jgi:hypothetical protein
MNRTIILRVFVLGSVAAGCLVLASMPAEAITIPPNWKAPELIPTNPSNAFPMPIDRVDGQDRFLDFDHFGVAGLAVPKLVGTDTGVGYWRRHPVIGWTEQNADQAVSFGGLSATSAHASLAFDRSERPVIAAVDLFSTNQPLVAYNLQPNGIFFAREEVLPTFRELDAGTSVAVDPLGRTGIAFVLSNIPNIPFIRYTLDADGNGMFDDDFFGDPLVLSAGPGTRPSLDFDPIARPYIGFIDENDHVGVAGGDVGLTLGTTTPDPAVTSSFVSLAINPVTGYPAIAYNDIDGNALKYAEFDGFAWNAEVVDVQAAADPERDASDMSVSLAFDPADGNPAIAYTRDEIGIPNTLAFAWNDGAWNTQTVDISAGVAGGAVSLAFNEALAGGFGNGLPAIAYVSGNGEYHYVEDPAITTLPGDFNGDGVVDAGDYATWRKGLGTIYSQEDYDVWRANFGTVVSAGASGSVTSVPEPAALTSLLVLSIALSGRIRRTTKS